MQIETIKNENSVKEMMVALSETIRTLLDVNQVIRENGPSSIHEGCNKLLEKCQELLSAEVCAIFIIKGRYAELEACRGYTSPHGIEINFEELRETLRYQVDPSDNEIFDGITGLVASTGKEFFADNWEEIKCHPSHAGKQDRLNIWNNNRPFRCMCAVPIKIDNETIGVLKVENKRDPEKRGVIFDDTDKLLLHMLANCFSMVIENTWKRYSKQLKGQETEDIRQILRERAVRLDTSNMAKVIEHTPSQIEIALSTNIPQIQGGPFNMVVIVGMGGSALPAEVVIDAFGEHLKVPVKVIRNYTLPSSINSRSLVIVSSFSGNTEEPLSVIESLSKDVHNIVVVSAGGRLTTLAKERHLPLIEIPVINEPAGFQPRSAIGYFVTYFTRLLTLAGVLEDRREELESVPQFLRTTSLTRDAEEVAVWLKQRIPLIYTDEAHLMSIARIAKIKFNENSKRATFFNALPEANHNEMIGFSKKGLGKFGILYLHDPDSHRKILDRFHVMKKVFMENKMDHVAFKKWDIPGNTKIEKIFAALIFADWCSYNLAILDGFDPTPVGLVESFKRELSMYSSPSRLPKIIKEGKNE